MTGASVRIHTGSGSRTAPNLYWHSGAYVWNNTTDKATLRNSAGTTLDTCSWDDPGSTDGINAISC